MNDHLWLEAVPASISLLPSTTDYLSALQASCAPDVLEQAARGVFDHVQHAIEAAWPAEIWIGHFFLRPISGKLHEQADARFMARRADVDQILEILAVHGQDIIESLDVRGDGLAPAQAADVDAAARAGLLGTLIRRLADVIGMRAGRIDSKEMLQFFILDQLTENPLCRRRAPDVTETYE